MTPRSPVPQEVSAELQRVVRRWHQLPLDHALSCVPAVRRLLDELAATAATAAATPGAARTAESRTTVPDLGPAVLMDQLTVLVYDACETGGATSSDLARRLGDLRRKLA